MSLSAYVKNLCVLVMGLFVSVCVCVAYMCVNESLSVYMKSLCVFVMGLCECVCMCIKKRVSVSLYVKSLYVCVCVCVCVSVVCVCVWCI